MVDVHSLIGLDGKDRAPQISSFSFPLGYLIVIPAALPIVDLASWSGRFFYTEFDFLILTTLAVRYWQHSWSAALGHRKGWSR